MITGCEVESKRRGTPELRVEADVFDERLVAAHAFLDFGACGLVPACVQRQQGARIVPGKPGGAVGRTAQAREISAAVERRALEGATGFEMGARGRQVALSLFDQPEGEARGCKVLNRGQGRGGELSRFG